MRRSTTGSSTVASTRSRAPQRGQASTSSANARRMRAAQVQLRGGRGARASLGGGPASAGRRAPLSGAGYFLVYLPLTHNYEHIGQANLLRGLLGQPGQF